MKIWTKFVAFIRELLGSLSEDTPDDGDGTYICPDCGERVAVGWPCTECDDYTVF